MAVGGEKRKGSDDVLMDEAELATKKRIAESAAATATVNGELSNGHL